MIGPGSDKNSENEGGGLKAVRNFSGNSSDLVGPPFVMWASSISKILGDTLFCDTAMFAIFFLKRGSTSVALTRT